MENFITGVQALAGSPFIATVALIVIGAIIVTVIGEK